MSRSLDWTALNARSPLLAALPEPARRLARQLELAKGARLFMSGDRPAAMYFVLSGEMHLVRHGRNGAEIVLQRARDGCLAEASLDHAAYHCDAVATAPSRVLALPMEPFRAALADEVFRARWMAHLARELRRVRTQAERMSLKSAEDRILHYIALEGEDGVLRLTRSRKDWAADLGLTHEALYRTLARMARTGRIRLDGPLIALAD